ncbi:SusD/RagB family nutrient-binding outer membrane lipoprotein [Dinghuibacter silviterrae]|uniref:SusD-like starch-binding protein associating with outer membrane n=1 Tax=Dinghuibacter silviterrae TaxID=1539049 RepID=A0A4R8DF67_9BACT|nr:SusD/RagB family nutrient-binding outer membrane lipoprotein [Dinghuibacter silviterrae]TDW95884.1 SusD-like starch-binding protein associating with outer membrane [Dinghuibacter silviterrae]
MKRKHTYIILAGLIAMTSCQKFSTLNTNPNSLTPSGASSDYLMAGVLTNTATWYGDLGSGVLSGTMQQLYHDAYDYDLTDDQWDPGTFDWSGNYYTLNNNKLLLQQAQASKWDFHQGVALVMRAFNFGNIADFWGDAPDSMALSGDQGGVYNFPTFDNQQSIYTRVIADLKSAIPFFYGTTADHPEITAATQSSDVYYGGDPTKWKKFAYSLLLRYYLRLSAKMNVQAGVEAVADSVFQGTADDCTMPFPGVDKASSYQFCSVYNSASEFNRNKLCGTLTMTLKSLQDPRIVIMGEPIVTPSEVSASQFVPGDNTTLVNTVNNIRYINPAAAAAANYKQYNLATYAQDRPYGATGTTVKNLYDTSSVYVGIPPSYSGYPDFQYNLNLSGQQATSINNYVSYLRRDIYDNPKGSLLAQRLASYSEICFDLAEAALKGWNVNGSAATWYYNGIQASFATWQVFTTYQNDVNNYYGCVKNYNAYIAQPSVAFNGTLAQIIQQKWIAAWQACNEAYMDWRRTGYPSLTVGWASERAEIPVRFTYPNSELQNNITNAQGAINNLQTTPYIGPDGANSSWSKFWLIEGTNQPW